MLVKQDASEARKNARNGTDSTRPRDFCVRSQESLHGLAAGDGLPAACREGKGAPKQLSLVRRGPAVAIV